MGAMSTFPLNHGVEYDCNGPGFWRCNISIGIEAVGVQNTVRGDGERDENTLAQTLSALPPLRLLFLGRLSSFLFGFVVSILCDLSCTVVNDVA